MNSFNVHALFPISVFTIQYHNHSKFKNFFFEYLKKNQDKIETSHYHENLQHINNTPNTNFLNDIKNELDFEDFLLNSCKFYINEIIGNEVDELIVTDCWINICGNEAFQPLHNHGNSYISGTYYLNYDPESHSHLRINSPYQGKDPGVPFLNINPKKYTEFNGKEVTCSFIQEGMLVLWPSNLVHGYSENTGENRISISMNFMPKQFISGPYSFTINR